MGRRIFDPLLRAMFDAAWGDAWPKLDEPPPVFTRRPIAHAPEMAHAAGAPHYPPMGGYDLVMIEETMTWAVLMSRIIPLRDQNGRTHGLYMRGCEIVECPSAAMRLSPTFSTDAAGIFPHVPGCSMLLEVTFVKSPNDKTHQAPERFKLSVPT